MKLLVFCPEETVTVEGTVRFELLLESDTANPLPEAFPLNTTAQDVLPGELMVELVQLMLPNPTDAGIEIVPEPPLEGIDVPPAVEATTLDS
jgi:hypothetical protein